MGGERVDQHSLGLYDENLKDIEKENSIIPSFMTPHLPPPVTTDPVRLNAFIVQQSTSLSAISSHNVYLETERSSILALNTSLKMKMAAAEWNANESREKASFLERYAATIVTERNNLLHPEGSKRNHFVYHSCCRRYAGVHADTIPSLTALRQERCTALQAEVHNVKGALLFHQEKKDRELNLAMQQCKAGEMQMESLRYKTELLQSQLTQHIGLHAASTRTVHSVDASLTLKEEECQVLSDALREQIHEYEEKGKTSQSTIHHLQEALDTLRVEHDRVVISAREEHDTANRFKTQWQEKETDLLSLRAETEALRSQVEMLQGSQRASSSVHSQEREIENVRCEADRAMNLVRREAQARERELLRIIASFQEPEEEEHDSNDYLFDDNEPSFHVSEQKSNAESIISSIEGGSIPPSTSFLDELSDELSEDEDDDEEVENILNRYVSRRELEESLIHS